MFWQNIINACLAIITTLLIYQNSVLRGEVDDLKEGMKALEDEAIVSEALGQS